MKATISGTRAWITYVTRQFMFKTSVELGNRQEHSSKTVQKTRDFSS